MFRTLIPLLLCLVCATGASAQTYTSNEFVAGAPLPWQSQYDPAARLTVGNEDGNVSAASHASSWATAVRLGGAHGVPGLLDEFTISSAGAPAAFGLGRRDCAITDDVSLDACLPVRWEPSSFFGRSVMVAVVKMPTNTVYGYEYNVAAGDVFSIERDGLGTIRFYRSTSTPGERRLVASYFSPFAEDGGTSPVEVRAVFAPDTVSREVQDGYEGYYCCL